MLSKHIISKSKTQLKQTRTERSDIQNLSSSVMSQVTEPSHLLCTLGSPLSTCPLHWINIGWVMGRVKHKETDLPPSSCKKKKKIEVYVSAFPSTAILFPLFLKKHHALLPNTDCCTYLCRYKCNVRLGIFCGDWPELKQLFYCQGSYGLLCH